jgi:predicted AlkP superfamily phosphohydrolase/phosphomutase
MRRAVLLGIEGLNPELIKLWLDDLPNLKKLQKTGTWGTIESTVPPAPPHSWTCSQCGRNPGAFGFWDYSYRDEFTYTFNKRVDSRIIDRRVRCLYRILPNLGQRIAIVDMPGIWPPPRIPAGYCISNNHGQRKAKCLTWPAHLMEEISQLLGGYIQDVPESREKYFNLDREKLLKQVFQMDSQRFELVKHFIHEKKCDYVATVIPGVELISHGFFRSFDEHHRYYDKDGRFKDALKHYYAQIDKKIGEVKELLDEDTVLLVLSTYSVQRRDGQINLNEWLVQNGCMTLHKYPSRPAPLTTLAVDWSKTKCWSVGSSGQVYINLKGREAQGIVEPDDHEKLLDELSDHLKRITDENGKTMQVQVFKRDDIHFGEFVNYGPDLFVIINGSRWSFGEEVGYGAGKVHQFNEETVREAYGPQGYYCIAGSDFPSSGELNGISLLNIAPTVIDIMNLRKPYSMMPYEMETLSIPAVIRDRVVPSTPAEGEKIRSRLEALGY